MATTTVHSWWRWWWWEWNLCVFDTEPVKTRGNEVALGSKSMRCCRWMRSSWQKVRPLSLSPISSLIVSESWLWKNHCLHLTTRWLLDLQVNKLLLIFLWSLKAYVLWFNADAWLLEDNLFISHFNLVKWREILDLQTNTSNKVLEKNLKLTFFLENHGYWRFTSK